MRKFLMQEIFPYPGEEINGRGGAVYSVVAKSRAEAGHFICQQTGGDDHKRVFKVIGSEELPNENDPTRGIVCKIQD